MKKKIKHIIKSCAVISLLAMTLFGCSQAAGPGPVGEQKFAITSIEFNKDRFYHSEAENPETEVTVTVKGTGFSLLKKEAKQEIKIAFYEKTPVGADPQDNTLTGVLINPELIKAASNQESRNPSDPTPVVPAPDPEVTDPTVPDAPVFTTENCKINYENNTATVTFKFSKLNKFCSQETLQGTTKASVKVEGTTEASNSTPASIPFIDTVSDKITFEANVIVNDKPTEIKRDLLITGQTFLTSYSLYDRHNYTDVSLDTPYEISQWKTKFDFSFEISGYNLDNTNSVIKIFNSKGIQEGNNIPVSYESFEEHNGEASLKFPQKIDTYTIKLFINGVEQKYYYKETPDGYEPQPIPTYTISVIQDSVINDVIIPVGNTCNLYVRAEIQGTDFTKNDKKDFIIKYEQSEISNFEYHDANTYYFIITIPKTPGTYPITVSYGNQTFNKDFIVIDDKAPSEVTNFNAIIDKKATVLSWIEPSDTDFEKVIISYDSSEIEVKKGTREYTVASTTPTNYTINTVDKNGNKSKGITIKSVNLESSEKPIIVDTKNINGTNFDIITFGLWPQTVKAEGIIINETPYNINGWTCYKGSDECYYTKVIAEPAANCYPTPKFSTGYFIKKGQPYYFKMEPIKWRVLTNDYNETGKKLLLAEKALMAGKFDDNYSTYKDSEIRARLNGIDKEVSIPTNSDTTQKTNYKDSGFLQKAFLEQEKLYIADTTLKDFGTVTAKVFLLGSTDILNKNYGFLEDTTSDTERIRENTDYARATGAWDENFKSYWWTRSDDSQMYASNNTCDGTYIKGRRNKSDTATSIVPAICINQF